MVNNSKLIKRLMIELKDFNQNLELNSNLLLNLSQKDDKNLNIWFGILLGPKDSIFMDHKFELIIEIPEEYPIKPPKISFKPNQIYHPNITLKTGEICLDILKNEWSPVWTLTTTCLAIQTLLADPEPSSPLNVDAANLLRCGDLIGFNSLAKMYLDLYQEP